MYIFATFKTNMKKLLIITILLFSYYSYSQESTSKKHEVKINMISLLAMSAIDVTYEHILSQESSLGLSLYSYVGNNNNDLGSQYRNFSITPYYRNYFSSNYNSGFFIEAFAMYNEYKDYGETSNPDRNYSDSYKNTNAFALGFAAGSKWVTQKGFLAEVSLGFGRNLFTKDHERSVAGRGGITIGKQF